MGGSCDANWPIEDGIYAPIDTENGERRRKTGIVDPARSVVPELPSDPPPTGSKTSLRPKTQDIDATIAKKIVVGVGVNKEARGRN